MQHDTTARPGKPARQCASR